MAGIYLAVMAAQFISLAFGRLDAGQSLASIALPSFVFLTLLTLPACWVGVVAGRQLGLGILRSGAGSGGSAGGVGRGIALASGLGLLLGGVLLALRFACQPYLPPELPELGFRGVGGGLAVSVGAAVGEEVWFRFGLMSALLWVAGRVLRVGALRDAVFWLVIVLASMGFALAHLPQLVSYGASAPFAVGATIAGNVAVGILYGWCFWRLGLLAAIAAHFSVDLVLHVISALIV
ncbi:hypothetical protein N788_00350 [Arenimonas donghaensis DSM 18148 = HO3-R19]|uniref:CAAX prenyl protease 2/Lysostaphin resistance protein A-like domain-containing protein n=2 Tax=Arenimonas TaxID=490567 RepID=A0A087ML99_9GAMM|nr:hypothetical protein N788_00350 [Arenimonas donghaensis DSM 18148 = HO3-R19]